MHNLLSLEGIDSLNGMDARSKVGHRAIEDLKAAHELQGNPQPIATSRASGHTEIYGVTPASSRGHGDYRNDCDSASLAVPSGWRTSQWTGQGMKWLVLAVNDECADWLRVCDVNFHDFSTDSLGLASRFE